MDDPFKMANPLNNGSTKKPQTKTTSFLEALREQGRSATSGVAGNAMDQLFGRFPDQNTQPQQQPDTNPQAAPQAPFNFAEFLRLREQRIRQQERGLAQQQYRTETVIFHQKEQKAKEEIEVIKAEIKKIIETSQEVSTELIAAEQAVMTNTVEAGTYQITFFQRIRNLLKLVSKRLSESQHWLEMFNARSKQKSHYWGMVKKSGTKYMLSQERYMATQAG